MQLVFCFYICPFVTHKTKVMKQLAQSKIVADMEIKQPNAITEARFGFTAVQLDIYFYLLALFKDSDADNVAYEISVQEMQRLTDRQWNYQQLRTATKDLLYKVIEFDDQDGIFCQTALIASTKYMKGQGKIRITVSEVIRPVLAQIKREYTSFQLYCALAMTSKFAKRIYMLCSQWKGKKNSEGIAFSQRYLVDEIKHMLDLKDPLGKDPEQFIRWSDFKKYVLDIAVKQINQYTDIKVSYLAHKEGRNYNILQFRIEEGNAHQLLIDFSDGGVNTKKIDLKIRLINSYGLNEKQASEAVRRIDNDALLGLLNRVNDTIKEGKIKGSIGGYTVKAIQNEWGILK